MCLLPDGKTAALIFQSGSVQDGGKSSGRTKIVLLDLASEQATATYWYTMTPEPFSVKPAKTSVNDLLALDANRFLVLERDGSGRDGRKSPPLARYKSVWLADLRDATNLLDSKTSPAQPVKKTLLFNLVDLVTDPATLSAKWEGITLIPPITDDSATLLMTADNDFLTPEIHDGPEVHQFPRADDAVPTQIYKIHVPLPEKP